MLNSAMTWPAGGELDILEFVGREPNRVFSIFPVRMEVDHVRVYQDARVRR